MSVEPLVDLADVKAHLNLTDDAQDVKLQGFIDAASAYIQNMTGPMTPQTFTEVHSGGSNVICVFNPPILSVTSITEFVGATGYTLTDVALGDATGAYAFSVDSPNSGIIRRRYNGGLVGPFAGGDHNITVTYVAGLTQIPADIAMAVLQDIAGLFQPTQMGTNPYYTGQNAADTPNPIGMFPRVAEILSQPSLRVPAIG